MPSVFHPDEMRCEELVSRFRALLNRDEKAKGTVWDYKKWLKTNKTILETEKRIVYGLLESPEMPKMEVDSREEEYTKDDSADTARVNKYSPMVKVGYWQEQKDVAEEDLCRYLRLRERGNLMVQKSRAIIGQNLKPINIPPKKFVRFGDTVQLIARYARSYKGRGKQEGLSLSSVLTGLPTAEMCLPIIEGTILSASPLIAPCVRNVFELLPWEENEAIRKDGRLKFGMEFVLRYIGTPSSQPYYVSVYPKRIIPSGNSSMHSEVILTSRKCWANVWRAFDANPKRRKESIGQPINWNQDVIVTSANINRCLCCETECWFTTFYGLECEATAFTYYNVYGGETVNNIWYFN